jgi:translation initiation factor 5A
VTTFYTLIHGLIRLCTDLTFTLEATPRGIEHNLYNIIVVGTSGVLMGGKTVIEVRTLKRGRYIILDDEPCKISDITTSSPGKHGSAKARIEAIGIFDGKKRSIVKPTGDKIDSPIIDKRSGMVTAMMGDRIQLMDMESYETFEVPAPAPEEVEGTLAESSEVEYLETLGRYKIIRVKGKS